MTKKWELYNTGDQLERKNKHCPKCGEGVFLGNHKDRLSCGKCGYTEFKGQKKETTEKTEESKPKETSEKK